MTTVYLLHLLEPLSPGHPAQHYLGSAEDLAPRLYAHQHGIGARFTAVAVERSIPFVVARTWDGGRQLERKLKRWHNGRKLCPICRGELALQLPLLHDCAPFIPVPTQEGETQHEDTCTA